MGIDLPPEKIAMKTLRHSNFLGCDNARFGGDRDYRRVVRLYTLSASTRRNMARANFRSSFPRYLAFCLRRLQTDLLMVLDVEEQHFRISEENASRLQADTRLSGYYPEWPA